MFNKNDYKQDYSNVLSGYETCNSCSILTSENKPIKFSKCCGTILCNICFTKHYKSLKTKYKCTYCGSKLNTEDFTDTSFTLSLLETFSFRKKQVQEVLNKTKVDFVKFEDYKQYCILREHYTCWLAMCKQQERFKSDKILYGMKTNQKNEIEFREKNSVKENLDEITKKKEVRKRIQVIVSNFKALSSISFGNNEKIKRTKKLNGKISLNCEEIEWNLFKGNLFKF
eukprot:GAHX01002591.1.p1 GENE.GAHX01002591.1~~GAHX01002591.1.p1  ORF type:complete len:227 (+),score=49.15 GAHX01002591.1:51-731(+)